MPAVASVEPGFDLDPRLHDQELAVPGALRSSARKKELERGRCHLAPVAARTAPR